MGLFAETLCDQHLFFLSSGKLGHILCKLDPLKVQLSENRFKEAFINPALAGIVGQCSA